MASSSLLSLPEELLFLWHTHRLEILLSAGVLIACARLAIHWRQTRRKAVLTPPLGSPVDEKVPIVTKNDLVEAEHFVPIPTAPGAVKSAEKSGPKRVTGVKKTRRTAKQDSIDSKDGDEVTIQPLIFYFSLGGSTKAYAEQLRGVLSNNQRILEPVLHDLTEIDYDDFFVSPPKSTSANTVYFYYFLIPSYDISTELDNLLDHLKETHHDFRIDTAPLSGLAGYAVFGFGDRQEWPSEEAGFGKDAVAVDKWMARLTGGKRAFPLGMGDVRSDVEERLQEWKTGVSGILEEVSQGKGLGEGAPGAGEAIESGDEDDEDDVPAITQSKPTRPKRTTRSQTSDLEDLKGPAPIPVDFTTAAPKAMVPTTSPTYTSLTKQGYSIIGTHSGVKTCRWTKSALRGRGSCYKYSFYGIASHRCMEATPSLSCSNKCVFCWRHGTNPVSTTWRWKVDDPNDIFDGMKGAHLRKIKTLRGVPGVRAERFEEAMRIRHCALSLVGEPIFYPRINELLSLLHGERISTFLVCNAQHPDHLAALNHVTQLYVSIDASNAESLKRIDRPLHRDYWQRFLRCMDILREKRCTQRTVFRLTLVKGFNIDEEAEGYAALVERARPSFVEVKGVTYCGTSTSQGAGLSMQNVPFYEEVSSFVLALESALKRKGLDYGIGAEHAHSCCILLADRERYFLEDGDGVKRWHTLIDYQAFFECLESGKEFGPEDYVGAATPEWAGWGRGGFDPRDERVDRKGRRIEDKS
ncbi:Fe-S oxidoreductase [Saxophila tyrrhenica]|uniref:tRNA 4-demethylwyosine synthase (AdoMet-dependent) n=1 Tax=Saxophila tyrrhenica TaxID=1690608 RepID=A0AAV9P2L0_9PEZI|nr:Fe-S oxidoreductase [Saxophila tyrrhenica]